MNVGHQRAWGRHRLFGVAIAIGLSAPGAAVARPATYVPPPCRPVVYHSAPGLKAQRACMNLGVRSQTAEPGNYLFLTPGGNRGLGAGIYRDNGELVWWHRAVHTDYNLTVVHFRGHPYLSLWSESPGASRYDSGAVKLYNEHYQLVGTIAAQGRFAADGADVHEFQITPQGDALLGIYAPTKVTVNDRRVPIFQYVIQELSLARDSRGIHAGRLLFQWQSVKHVPVSQSHAPIQPHKVWDYFHGNSIAQDTDGNLIVSARDTWGIYKINVPSGRIMWEAGAKGDHTLPQPWCYQHDVVPLGEDRYSLFDDGGAGLGCRPPSTGHPARGLTISVDPNQTPAGVIQLRAYAHTPSIFTAYCGGMQLQTNGDALIGWGNVPEVTEYGSSGTVRLDLSLSNWSYRAYRFPWVGEPLARPSVAAARSATDTTVWASWNGSTEVQAWRVLAGPGPTHLHPVGSVLPKRDFETTILLHRRYATVAVQALNSAGRVLATSRSIAPGPAS